VPDQRVFHWLEGLVYRRRFVGDGGGERERGSSKGCTGTYPTRILASDVVRTLPIQRKNRRCPTVIQFDFHWSTVFAPHKDDRMR
jgi:hypothetical protein